MPKGQRLHSYKVCAYEGSNPDPKIQVIENFAPKNIKLLQILMKRSEITDRVISCGKISSKGAKSFLKK